MRLCVCDNSGSGNARHAFMRHFVPVSVCMRETECVLVVCVQFFFFFFGCDLVVEHSSYVLSYCALLGGN